MKYQNDSLVHRVSGKTDAADGAADVPGDRLPQLIRDLPLACFPVLIEFSHPATGEVVHQIRVEAPAPGTRVKVYIPPLAQQLGHRVVVRITFGDGEVVQPQ